MESLSSLTPRRKQRDGTARGSLGLAAANMPAAAFVVHSVVDEGGDMGALGRAAGASSSSSSSSSRSKSKTGAPTGAGRLQRHGIEGQIYRGE